MLTEWFEHILQETHQACRAVYAERLVSLAVFGSVARGMACPDSDIDLLLVVDDLPHGRIARVREFDVVEDRVTPALHRAADQGVHTTLSPVLKTPAEVDKGSPLFLDMTDQARLLEDRGGFLQNYLEQLSARLKNLGARRVQKGGGYYWLLKPDRKAGEVIEL